MIFSIFTRFSVLGLLCTLAMLTEYNNLKIAYNHPRLVELSSGPAMRVFYESTDKFFSIFGEPAEMAQRNGGMTWSIRIMGTPFTDPVAALSVLAKSRRWELGFALGLLAPIGLALIFGRVFCSYVCPASLLFFAIARFRRILRKYFYFPDYSLPGGFAWGVLAGGLGVAVWIGHGIWSLLLPYFALGQTLFQGIAFGSLSVSLGSLIVFSILDLCLGRQFTCRYVCPTGRLLGFMGQKSLVSIKRDATECLTSCQACVDICPMKVNPKMDETVDCSLCGECLVICPTHCLSISPRNWKTSS